MNTSTIPDFFDRVGATILGTLENMGQMTLTTGRALRFILRGQIDFGKVLQQTAAIGFDSLPMTLLICIIAGSCLALQTADKFAATGADNFVGGLVALAIVREMGPIFACLTVGARSGTAIAAEIANMRITEQIDALLVMHVSPIRYLVVPRLIACVIALPLLTFIGETAGVLGGMVVAKATASLHQTKYLESVWLFVSRRDIAISMYKAAIFGVILAVVSCTIGLTTKGGAKEVGSSTTRAVVWIATAIIIADFFLSWIFFGGGS